MKEKGLIHQSRFWAVLLLGFISVSLLLMGTGVAAAAENNLQSATATSSGGQLQLPTATPTLARAATNTPARTLTPSPVMAEIIGDPTNLRSLPTLGDEYIVDSVDQGLLVPVVARWVGTEWYQVAWENGPDGKAWVHGSLILIRGDVTTIPITEPPPAPTANPTQIANQLTATILVQTPGAVEAATATAVFAPTIISSTQSAGGNGQGANGVLPTFTPPPHYNQREELPDPVANGFGQSGIPPAVIIVGLAAMGVLTLLFGLIRRLF